MNLENLFDRSRAQVHWLTVGLEALIDYTKFTQVPGLFLLVHYSLALK